MNSANLLCTLCQSKAAFMFCCCTSPETYLCKDCIFGHTDKVLGKEHATRPINQLRFYSIPGYFTRLQARVDSFPALKQQALQGNEAIDRVAEEYKLQVEKVIWEVITRSKEVARQLSELRETLNREMQAAVEEVEMTLEEDQPQLRTQYGPSLRVYAESGKQIELLSFSIETCSIPPQDWVTLQIQPIQTLSPSIFNRLELSEEPDMLSQEAKLKLSQLPPFPYSTGTTGIRKGPVKEIDGSVYIGEWLDFQRHGQGKWLTASGGLVEGYWENGLLHGKGREILHNGNMYEGDYFKGMRHGFGRWEDLHRKNSYEGRWLNDKIHGKGIYHYEDGGIYEGNFENGLKSGLGVMRWDSGVYEGEFREGKMHGKGKSVVDGKEYEGDFVANKKHGKGIYKWDGKVYDGDWADGKMHGKGYITNGQTRKLYKFENGTRHECLD